MQKKRKEKKTGITTLLLDKMEFKKRGTYKNLLNKAKAMTRGRDIVLSLFSNYRMTINELFDS